MLLLSTYTYRAEMDTPTNSIRCSCNLGKPLFFLTLLNNRVIGQAYVRSKEKNSMIRMKFLFLMHRT